MLSPCFFDQDGDEDHDDDDDDYGDLKGCCPGRVSGGSSWNCLEALSVNLRETIFKQYHQSPLPSSLFWPSSSKSFENHHDAHIGGVNDV